MHDTELILDELEKKLPAVVSRKMLSQELGGLLAPRTLANLDSLGKGPKHRVQIGRSVGYTKAAALNWLASRLLSSSASEMQSKNGNFKIGG